MEANEKPFACTIEGCSMRFTNEDHLTVHKKKHDMILNLGIGQKNNSFVADQTPTPTRFIRNCEEVGLFQDLQINPFDETFRKAVEAGKMGNQLHYPDSLTVPAGADDTLHTPHIFPFPHSNDNNNGHFKSSNSTTTANENLKRKNSDDHLQSGESDSLDEPIAASGSYTKIEPVSTRIPIPIVSNPVANNPVIRPTGRVTVKDLEKQETVSVAGQSMQLLLRMPDGQLVQLVQESKTKPSLPANVTPIPTPENGLALAKMKLKAALTNHSRVSSSSSSSSGGETGRIRKSLIEPRRPASPTPHGEGGSAGEEGGDDRKVKFRERNRAAAMRCREKRKTWVQELERRADDMQSTNQTLQTEVTSLRAEVAQLKTLLLAHKNCPITQAMNQAQLINVSTLPIETIQTCLLPTSQPSRITFQPAATTSKPLPTVILSKSPPDKIPIANLANSAKRKRLPTVVVTSHCSSDQELLTIPGSQPTYVSFKHLLSACASNENNLNMEKSGAMMSAFSEDEESEDAEEVMTINRSGVRDGFMRDGVESMVIKVNPNAIRFRNAEEIISRDQRHMTGGSSMVEMVVDEGGMKNEADS